MKLLNAMQIRDLDQLSIQSENIESIVLMERAASVYFREMMIHCGGAYNRVIAFAGSGNNGGDAVAIARMALSYFEKVEVVLCNMGALSKDLSSMLEALPSAVDIIEINKGAPFEIDSDEATIVIDGIFGSGLNRPVEGYWADIIHYINKMKGYKCTIDIPSGMFSDVFEATGAIVKADWTLSFEMPKKVFFVPEAQEFLGHWNYASIGLNKTHHNAMKSTTYYITEDVVSGLLKGRSINDHKGTLGHGALITGSYGMAGASYLSAMGALRSGIGKLSCYVPEVVQDMIQTQVPEAICTGNNGYQCIESVHLAYRHEAIGLGCGIGTNCVTKDWLDHFLNEHNGDAMVIDADGLNIIAASKWQERIPRGSIITPHPGEFRRLFGDFSDYTEAFRIQEDKAKALGIYIILKIPHTRIVTPEGKVYYNQSGNPGMATAGSGDVLTGIIVGLLAQGYSSEDAGVLSVYLHGKAGDLAANDKGKYGMIARDIIEFLPYAIKSVETKK
jgi:hydroxyethylthiazole kinase-like uncharacterized protein yjeF